MARGGPGLFENKFERLPYSMAKLSYLVAMVLVVMVLVAMVLVAMVLVAMVLVAMTLVVVFTGFFFSSRGRFLLFVAFKYELETFTVVVDVVSW